MTEIDKDVGRNKPPWKHFHIQATPERSVKTSEERTSVVFQTSYLKRTFMLQYPVHLVQLDIWNVSLLLFMTMQKCKYNPIITIFLNGTIFASPLNLEFKP